MALNESEQAEAQELQKQIEQRRSQEGNKSTWSTPGDSLQKLHEAPPPDAPPSTQSARAPGRRAKVATESEGYWYYRTCPADILASRGFPSMNCEQRGFLYTFMLCSFRDGGSLPAAIPPLAVALDLPEETVSQNLPALIQNGQLKRRGKRLVCPYIELEREYRERKNAQNRENANSTKAREYQERRKNPNLQ